MCTYTSLLHVISGFFQCILSSFAILPVDKDASRKGDFGSAAAPKKGGERTHDIDPVEAPT
jgi:hypothetical protein